jgi:hypothetical protein
VVPTLIDATRADQSLILEYLEETCEPADPALRQDRHARALGCLVAMEAHALIVPRIGPISTRNSTSTSRHG